MLNKILTILLFLFFVSASISSENKTNQNFEDHYDGVLPLEDHHFDDIFGKKDDDHQNATENLDHVIDHPNPDEEERSNVIEIFGADFNEKLMMYSYALVYFDKFDLSNEHFFQFNEAAKAAKKLDFNHLTIIFAKVDCQNEVTLCKENGITSYPSIKLYKRGDRVGVFKGPLTQEEFTNYLFSQIAHRNTDHYIFHDEL